MAKKIINQQHWDQHLSTKIGRFRTVGDVRDYILKEYPKGPPRAWHSIGVSALEAAETGDTEELEAALRIMKVMGKV